MQRDFSLSLFGLVSALFCLLELLLQLSKHVLHLIIHLTRDWMKPLSHRPMREPKECRVNLLFLIENGVTFVDQVSYISVRARLQRRLFGKARKTPRVTKTPIRHDLKLVRLFSGEGLYQLQKETRDVEVSL